MTIKKIYKCSVCGNVIELLYESVGELHCCGKAMELLVAKTEDVGMEKHVPVIEKTETGIKVKVGSIPHPMEEKHYIVWVELVGLTGNSCKKFLKPGDVPEVEFITKEENPTVRIYCNIHGLWKN